MQKRGQASIELITILAVSLVVLGVIMATSRGAFEDMQTSLDSQMAEKSMRTLASDAALAYNSGAGTVIKSHLHVPVTTLENGSYLKDNLLNLHLEHKYGVKDLPQPFSVPVEGNLKFTPGDYEVYCVSHSGYVYITESPSLVPSTNIIYATLAVGETRDTTISIKNPGPEESIVTASLSPTPSDMAITLSTYSKKIGPGESAPLTISVSSDKPADYDGYINLITASGERDSVHLKIRVS